MTNADFDPNRPTAGYSGGYTPDGAQQGWDVRPPVYGGTAFGGDQAPAAPQGGYAQYPTGYGAPYGSAPYGHGYQGAPFAYDPSAPYGRDMFTGEPLSEKSKLVAGLLQIFLGTLGIGRFYMGSTGVGVAQLVVWLLGIVTLVFGIGFLLIVGVWIWSVVDGIILLSGRPRDGAGLLMR